MTSKEDKLKALRHIQKFQEEEKVQAIIERIKSLITDEIVIAQKEGEKTSRLTSLYMRISEFIKKD